MQKAQKVVNHLAAGGYGPGDVVTGNPGISQKIVHGLSYGAQVASAAELAFARTPRSSWRLWLSPPVQVVKQFPIDRQEHGLHLS